MPPVSLQCPIIPRPLPSEVVKGEHFVAANLLSLIPGASSPAREEESKATGRELVISTQSAQTSSTSKDSGRAPQASKQVERGGRLERPPLAIKDFRLTPRVSKKKKGRRQKAAGAGEEDFIPWVPPISRRSSDREEENEKEDDMSSLVHNFSARKRREMLSLSKRLMPSPKWPEDRTSLVRIGGSEVLAIIISGSLETSLNDQPAMGNVTLEESKEVSPVSAALQVIHPPE